MKKLLLIIVLLASSNLHSQDTVNAKFFPMHVGNYYVYHYLSPFFNQYHFASITKDTIISGKIYFYFSNSGFLQNRWVRYDSTSGNLLEYKPGQGCSQYINDQIIDSLPSSLNDEILNCGFYSYKKCSSRSDSLISFDHDGLTIEHVTYRKGVGLVNHCSDDPPPCIGHSYLQGAVINGVLWGDTTLTNVNQISTSTPESFNLYQNYPNPFNPATNIKFDIPKSGNVRITVYDITGRQIAELLNQDLSPGTYETSWNTDGFSSGVYYYRFETEGFTQTRKMLLIK